MASEWRWTQTKIAYALKVRKFAVFPEGSFLES